MSSSKVFPQVEARGSCIDWNSIVGRISKPIGGICRAPVAKESMSSKVTVNCLSATLSHRAPTSASSRKEVQCMAEFSCFSLAFVPIGEKVMRKRSCKFAAVIGFTKCVKRGRNACRCLVNTADGKWNISMPSLSWSSSAFTLKMHECFTIASTTAALLSTLANIDNIESAR